MTTLEIKDLHVEITTRRRRDKQILNGVTLTIARARPTRSWAPNVSGKSTLSYPITGHPKYTVTSGSITLDGETSSR